MEVNVRNELSISFQNKRWFDKKRRQIKKKAVIARLKFKIDKQGNQKVNVDSIGCLLMYLEEIAQILAN